MKNKNLEIKPARNGVGVFACKNFKEHEIIMSIEGKIVPATTLLKIGGTYLDNTYRFGPETYLSPEGSIGEFVNHSCEPNSGVIKKQHKLYLIAIKPISKNEEVLFDYSTILGNDDIWKMKCNCGMPQCRKIIKQFGSLPETIQTRYIERCIVPKYILNS